MKLIGSKGPVSKLMVVGDFPTTNEYIDGWAFAGSTGTLLDMLTTPSGVKAGNLFRTHYFKVPIQGYGSPIKSVKAEAVARVSKEENWDIILQEEIESINPNCILAMGELAMNNLTGEKGIKKWRGSILPLHPRFGKDNIKVVSTYSAREIWEQNQHCFPYVQWDVGRAIKYSEYSERFKFSELIWIPKTPGELHNWWNRAQHGEFLTLDIETHHGFVTCIGFCHDGNEAISVPLLIGPGMDWESRGKIYQLVSEILLSPIPKVNQNIKYDWTVLQNFGFNIRNIMGDTMLMAHCIYPEFEKNLGFLNSIYTEMPFYKDEGRTYDPRIHSVDRLLKYNARDCLCTWQIWKAQQEDANALGVQNFYFEKVHPTFFIYKRMDQRGIRIDEEQRQRLVQKYLPILYELQLTLNLVADKQVNINSHQQVGEFIYKTLSCPAKTHLTASGKVTLSTGEEVIEDLYINYVTDKARIQLLKSLIVARKIYRILSFLQSPVSPDSRMRTSYKLHGTETGRTSAGKALEEYYEISGRTKRKIHQGECGGSFQTIPKHGYEFGKERLGADLRSIFVPSSGYCFVEGDQAQAEDRVVCTLAQDWEGLEILNKREFKRNKYGLKDDRHVMTAMLILSKPFEEITPDDRQEIGKKTRHAGNYSMGAYMLAVMSHLSHRTCQKLLDTFHATNPKIRGVFHSEVKHAILTGKYLVSPHGRRRDFFGKIDEEMYKQAFATIPQATVSDHTKFTIITELCKLYPEPMAFPLVEAHDSAMFEVKTELREKFSEDFLRICETPINFDQCTLSRDYNLVIPGEVSWSETNWEEMKH